MGYQIWQHLDLKLFSHYHLNPEVDSKNLRFIAVRDMILMRRIKTNVKFYFAEKQDLEAYLGIFAMELD